MTVWKPCCVVRLAVIAVGAAACGRAQLGLPRIHADALLDSPDIAAIDAVIDRIAELPDVVGADSKVARWLDGVGPPRPAQSGHEDIPSSAQAPPTGG